jgi:acyl-coenzyme A thioesterase 9
MRYQFGVDRQVKRKDAAKKSLTYTAPSSEESNIIHNMFLNIRNSTSMASEPISKTRIQKTLLMHLQDRNLHGKVFGGFLMR